MPWLSVALLSAQARTTLDIYVVDVEGGNATLFVSPSGESLLIDTGNGGAAAVRDADRIMAAVKDAGLTQIDHLITTHWHGDHFGGMAELAKRIPIEQFIDHGPNVQPERGGRRVPAEGLSEALRQGEAHGREAGRQDRGRRASTVRVVASAGQVHHDAACRAPASRNPYCASLQAEGSRSDRERAVGRQHRHVRQVPRRRTWAI